MFGCPLGVDPDAAPRLAGDGGVPEREPSLASLSALMAAPAPAIAPPATRLLLRNVRRSTLLCCSGSMPSMRVLILGSTLARGGGLAGGVATADAATTAPSCVPSTIDNSALQPGGVTVSPL